MNSYTNELAKHSSIKIDNAIQNDLSEMHHSSICEDMDEGEDEDVIRIITRSRKYANRINDYSADQL